MLFSKAARRACSSVAGAVCVKPSSMGVTETLTALNASLRVPQEKRGCSCEKTCGDDHAPPNDARGKNLRRGRTKRRKQNYQRRLANPNATLRDGHHGDDLCKWPGEEPHAQWQTEATGDAQESGEQNIGALHGSSEQPAENQPPGTPRNRADRVTKLREPAPDSNGTSAQERPVQCHSETKKNCRNQDAGKQYMLCRPLQWNGQRTSQ